MIGIYACHNIAHVFHVLTTSWPYTIREISSRRSLYSAAIRIGSQNSPIHVKLARRYSLNYIVYFCFSKLLIYQLILSLCIKCFETRVADSKCTRLYVWRCADILFLHKLRAHTTWCFTIACGHMENFYQLQIFWCQYKDILSNSAFWS